MVQAAHAAQESGAKFGCPDSCHMVLCSVNDECELRKAGQHAAVNDIQTVMFYEPDPCDDSSTPMGYTALCTEPIYGTQRRVFRGYKTWKQDAGKGLYKG